MIKRISMIALLLFLTSCGKNTTNINHQVITNTELTKTEKNEEISSEVTTTIIKSSDIISPISQTTTIIQPTSSEAQETAAVSETTKNEIQPVYFEDMVEKASDYQVITTCHSEAYQQTIESAETTTKTTSLTTTVTQTVSLTTAHVTTAIMTDPIIETIPLLINDGTDYCKAKVVYDYMKENGYGTCVNYACQTYELCQYIGLPCYIVWTNAGMYGHTANTVYVNNAWYILDTHGGYFLDYNYGFTEVVDIDENYISDSSIISLYSYDETIQMESP